MLQRYLSRYLRRINKKWLYPIPQKRYFSVLSEKEFDEITKRKIKELFCLLKIDAQDICILDMLFSVTNPTQGMEFFDDSYALMVDRDPRDVFVSAKLHPEDSRFMPNDSVEGFIDYYKLIHQRMQESDHVIIVQYEDLIYKYEKTTKSICDRLKINYLPDNEFVFFDPTYSVRYTYRKNLYSQYPEDIKAIEKELRDYLYDFDSAKSPTEDSAVIARKGSVDYKGWNMK